VEANISASSWLARGGTMVQNHRVDVLPRNRVNQLIVARDVDINSAVEQNRKSMRNIKEIMLISIVIN
jgi:hypothetical protein